MMLVALGMLMRREEELNRHQDARGRRKEGLELIRFEGRRPTGRRRKIGCWWWQGVSWLRDVSTRWTLRGRERDDRNHACLPTTSSL
jgi:hypothetical protein